MRGADSKTQYFLGSNENGNFLKAVADNAASGLGKEIKIDLNKTPYLNITWKVEKDLRGINEKSKKGHDYAARVFVVKKTGATALSNRAMNYVFSSNEEVNNSHPSPYTKKSIDFVLSTTIDNLNEWVHKNGKEAKWIVKDDYFTVNPGTGDILTKKSFGSCQLHVEFRTPENIKSKGQGRGNSGVYFMEDPNSPGDSGYEIQVLDSYENRTYSNGQAASVYKQHIPLVNASKKPGEWQSYDIIFKAPIFSERGSLESPAYVTVFHNGVLVQNNVQIQGYVKFIGYPEYKAHPPKLPLKLQDHSNKVSYRNIWVREL